MPLFLVGAATKLAIQQLHAKKVGEHDKSNNMNIKCH